MSETLVSCWTRLKHNNELLDRYREKSRQLSDLLTDFELARENEIYFIVDFSEIFVLASVDEYNDREGLIRKETVATLLYGDPSCYGTPVLINPYRTEFRRKVLGLKREIRRKKIEPTKLRNAEDGKIETIRERLLKIQSKGRISKKDSSDIINALRDLGLHSLLRGEPWARLRMFEEIGKRIEKNSLPLNVQRKSLAMHPNIGNSDYFKSLLLLGAKKGLVFHLVNDYIDSQALELIDLVNNEKDNIILLFYSGTQNMKDLLGRGRFGPLIEERHVPLGEFPLPSRAETLNFLRTPEMMAEFFYAKRRGKNWEELIKAKNNKIGEIVGMITPIKSLLDSCPMDEAKCENRMKCQKDMEEIESKINVHDRLLDSVDICEILSNYGEFFRIAERSLRKDEEIVTVLMENKGRIEELLQDEKNKLLEEVNSILDQLNRQFIDLFQFETFDKLRIRLRRLRGKPYYIFFYNIFIKKRIDDLIELIEDQSKKNEKRLNKIKDSYTNLINCISIKELDHERHLLLATLLFAHSYYDEATDLSQEKMRDVNVNDRVYREFCLVNILSNYMRYLRSNKEIYREWARSRCVRFCRDHEDPRFCNVLGVIQLSIIVDEGGDIDQRIDEEVLPYYEKAQQYIEKKEKDYGDLKLVLKNNMADAILTKIKISSEELVSLEDLLNEIKDMGYFPFKDTMAKFYERKFLETDIGQYLEKAAREYEDAVHLATKQEAEGFFLEEIVENLEKTLVKSIELSEKDPSCSLDKELMLRCFFYQYAYSEQENSQERIIGKIKVLIEEKIRSSGWNMNEIAERAIRDGHSCPAFLIKLTELVSGKISVQELDNFELWKKT
jgi:hypothetical protein